MVSALKVYNKQEVPILVAKLFREVENLYQLKVVYSLSKSWSATSKPLHFQKSAG